MSCAKTGEETIGPTSVIHKREGLRLILEAETPVLMEHPLNIFHDCLSDIPNDSFVPINNNHKLQCHMKKYTLVTLAHVKTPSDLLKNAFYIIHQYYSLIHQLPLLALFYFVGHQILHKISAPMDQNLFSRW